jgi:hypothetical protein
LVERDDFPTGMRTRGQEPSECSSILVLSHEQKICFIRPHPKQTTDDSEQARRPPWQSIIIQETLTDLDLILELA